MHRFASPSNLSSNSHLEKVVRCFDAVLVEFKLRAQMSDTFFSVSECDHTGFFSHAMVVVGAKVVGFATCMYRRIVLSKYQWN